jgi:hypothetical protein
MGIFDGFLSPEVQSLLGPQIGQGGLLGQPRRPDNGLLETIFGQGPGDPRGDAMAALGVGMMRGDFPSGIENANRALALGRERQLQDQRSQLGLLTTGLQLDSMLDTRKRQRGIRGDLERLYSQGGSQVPLGLLGASDGPAAPGAGAPADLSGLGSVARVGADVGATGAPAGPPSPSLPPGLPMVPQSRGSMPALQQPGMPQYSGASAGASSFGGPGSSPAASGGAQLGISGPGGALGDYRRAQLGADLSQRLIQEAQVYARWGDFERADKMYEQAAKWVPEVKEIGVSMMGDKPVQVITYKDGRQQVTDFSPTPKTHWLDTGGAVQPIDEYTLAQRGQAFPKTPTPADRIAAGNLDVSRKRLALDETTPQYMQTDSGLIALPKRPGGSGPIVGQPVSLPNGDPITTPKALTETQGKATTFAARMIDANKVIQDLQDKVAPNQVAQAGYRSDVPSWVPGGQIVGAGLTAANQTFNPAVTENAQRYRQAQENWVTANLRQESGAAISKDEMDKDVRKWFPQPGETQAVIAQKAASRRVAQEAMAAQAGPGAKQIPGILERAAEATAQPSGGSAALPLPRNPTAQTLTRGQVYTLPNGKSATWDGMQFRVAK